MSDDPDLWNTHAEWWQREFTDGADAEYEEQIIPLAVDLLAGRTRVIDVGAGDGQITRALNASGSPTIGLDPTPNQTRVASARGGSYLLAGAEALPFADGCFDGALACLVFEHIDSSDTAISEVSRVLAPGGRFVFMLNHPLLQTPGSGWIDDQVFDDQYWRLGPYLVEANTVEEVQKDVFIPFIHRPLHRYVNAMADSGLILERMVEPAPPDGFLARSPGFAAAAAIPRLLVLIARKG